MDLASINAGLVRGRLAATMATVSAAAYLVVVIIFGYLHSRAATDEAAEDARSAQITAYFSVLFNVQVAGGLLIALACGAIIGVSLAADNADPARLARAINAMPLVRAARDACATNPALCG